MKTITSALITLLSYAGIIGCGIWTIVSFIIYLVKDIPFDWRSLWGFILSWCLFLLSAIFTYVFSRQESNATASKFRSEAKKSGFLQRIEAAQKKRDEERNKLQS